MVEAERLRPCLNKLLELADYVVTSAHFPEAGPTLNPAAHRSHCCCQRMQAYDWRPYPWLLGRAHPTRAGLYRVSPLLLAAGV